MSKSIAILQSNYIPWKGYFDLINSVDEFVIYDDVQYTKNDWRNRNIIKTNQGLKWLTIPVRQKKLGQLIIETKISDPRWAKKHWASISQNYSKSKYFKEYKEVFEDIYLSMDKCLLSEVNFEFIKLICELIGIHTKIRWSHEFELVDGQTERLLSICTQCDASIYISGPAAKSYFDQELAIRRNIKVLWMDYGNYRPYRQLYPPFGHGVTILDLLFAMGPNSKSYMTSSQINHHIGS